MAKITGPLIGGELSETLPDFGEDVPPYAVTEEHLESLVEAIEAEGYRILINPETGEVMLERRDHG